MRVKLIIGGAVACVLALVGILKLWKRRKRKCVR